MEKKSYWEHIRKIVGQKSNIVRLLICELDYPDGPLVVLELDAAPSVGACELSVADVGADEDAVEELLGARRELVAAGAGVSLRSSRRPSPAAELCDEAPVFEVTLLTPVFGVPASAPKLENNVQKQIEYNIKHNTTHT